MERNEMKIVFEDGGKTKVIKGYILKEDEFIYKIQAIGSNEIITIGKRAIIKIGGLK